MRICNFTYTKDSGDVSQRRVLMLSEPHKHYLGLDLSNLSDDGIDKEDLETLLTGLEELESERNMLIQRLGFGRRWRQFKPEGIEWTEG